MSQTRAKPRFCCSVLLLGSDQFCCLVLPPGSAPVSLDLNVRNPACCQLANMCCAAGQTWFRRTPTGSAPGGSASCWEEQRFCWFPSPSLVTHGNYLVGLIIYRHTGFTKTCSPTRPQSTPTRDLLDSVGGLVLKRAAPPGGPLPLSAGSQEFVAMRVSEAHQLSDGSHATAADPQFGRSAKDMPRWRRRF